MARVGYYNRGVASPRTITPRAREKLIGDYSGGDLRPVAATRNSLLEETGVVILVTGGAGFIGSNFVLDWVEEIGEPLINLDALTYAGNLSNLVSIGDDPRHVFIHGNIKDRKLVRALLTEHKPRAIVHLAAESHVDRSIFGPDDFVQTNFVGTFCLLEEARAYWDGLLPDEQQAFKFLHVSTDEVYGTLNADDAAFNETTSYAPNSPYSASKAGADFLVRAYHHTYGLPTVITNCSNNYGPYQFPEKLVPLMIIQALKGMPLPVYGDGQNVRDWLYVCDHCAALRTVLAKGIPGQTYNVGGRNEMTNLEVVTTLCDILDQVCSDSPHVPHHRLISFVADRPGHDRRYAIDASKIEQQLGWRPKESFGTGIRKTIDWYINHSDWLNKILSGEYQNWMAANYGRRMVLS